MCVTPEFNNWIVFTPSNLLVKTTHFLQLIENVADQQNFNLRKPTMSVICRNSNY